MASDKSKTDVSTKKSKTTAKRNSGSFRDPSGYVFERDGRIFRTISDRGFENYEHSKKSGFLDAAIEKHLVVDCREIKEAYLGVEAKLVVEHPKLPFISYPYEWSFEVLKTAAIFHLDLQLMALEYDVALSDASAYNVQFIGTSPIFIDVLSFRKYTEGEYWGAHRQFCEQFLNPLLLRAERGVGHNATYRGNLEGISTTDIDKLLPVWRKFTSWTLFTQVFLQAKFQSGANKKGGEKLDTSKQRSLSKNAFTEMLTQLRNWISKLEPKDKTKTVWADYAGDHSYADQETQAKREFVMEFSRAVQPKILWDLGCNTGDFTKAAQDITKCVGIGFDFDQNSLDEGFLRARKEKSNFFSVFLDAANPSPSQGWDNVERLSLGDRANADAVLALAFEHHLAIGRNVPLPQVIDWICSLAPSGVIEFVPKSDPMIVQMLSLREDIFDEYNIENFESALQKNAKIVKSIQVSQAGRRLYWYEKN